MPASTSCTARCPRAPAPPPPPGLRSGGPPPRPPVRPLPRSPLQPLPSLARERVVVDWSSRAFPQPSLHPFEGMALPLILGFALKRPPLYDLLLSVVAVALALQSVRNIALFIAATTPVLINTYSEAWKEISKARGWKLQLPTQPLFAVVTAIALTVIDPATVAHIATEPSPSHQSLLTDTTDPVGAPYLLVP